jgi:hypothetical protein
MLLLEFCVETPPMPNLAVVVALIQASAAASAAEVGKTVEPVLAG